MREEQRLSPLSETTEFRLRPDAPDVRGWPVEGGDGVVLGLVAELLVDRGAARVRYIEIALESETAGARRALVPIGLALVSRDRDVIIVMELPDHDELRDESPGDFSGERYDERRFLAERAPDDDQDFSYLVGVGGAMTDRDEDPEVVGEVTAGQIRVPVIEEHTRRAVAPEERQPPDRRAGGDVRRDAGDEEQPRS